LWTSKPAVVTTCSPRARPARAAGDQERAPGEQPLLVAVIGQERLRHRVDALLQHPRVVHRLVQPVRPGRGIGLPAEQYAVPAVQRGRFEHQLLLVGDRELAQIDPLPVDGDLTSPDHPRPGQDPVEYGELVGRIAIAMGLVRQQRQRALAAVQLGVERREDRNVSALGRLQDGLEHLDRARLEQVLDHEQPEHHVDHPIAQPDAIIAIFQGIHRAGQRVDPHRCEHRRTLVQLPLQVRVAVREVGDRHHRTYAGRHLRLGQDRPDDLLHRRGVGQPVFLDELGEERQFEQRLVEHRVVHPADSAAHVDLEQMKSLLVLVHIRPAHPAGRRTASSDHGLRLRLGETDRAGVRRQVAVEHPLRQPGQCGMQQIEVLFQLVVLTRVQECRAAEAPAEVGGGVEFRVHGRADRARLRGPGDGGGEIIVRQ
jgi:hypothetical protein